MQDFFHQSQTIFAIGFPILSFFCAETGDANRNWKSTNTTSIWMASSKECMLRGSCTISPTWIWPVPWSESLKDSPISYVQNRGFWYTSPRSILSTVYLLPVRKLPKNQGKSVDDSWQCEAYTHSPLFCAFFALLESKSVAVCQVKLAFEVPSCSELCVRFIRIDWTIKHFSATTKDTRKTTFPNSKCWIHVVSPSSPFVFTIPPTTSWQIQLTKRTTRREDPNLAEKHQAEKSQIHSVPEGQNELSKSKFGTAAFSYQVVSLP